MLIIQLLSGLGQEISVRGGIPPSPFNEPHSQIHTHIHINMCACVCMYINELNRHKHMEVQRVK